MKVTKVHNRYLLRGVFLHHFQLKVGQVWAPISGMDREVTIIEISNMLVTYKLTNEVVGWLDSYLFQQHYALVLPDNNIPKELL